MNNGGGGEREREKKERSNQKERERKFEKREEVGKKWPGLRAFIKRINREEGGEEEIERRAKEIR